jgi:hypothetical protein
MMMRPCLFLEEKVIKCVGGDLEERSRNEVKQKVNEIRNLH